MCLYTAPQMVRRSCQGQARTSHPAVSAHTAAQAHQEAKAHAHAEGGVGALCLQVGTAPAITCCRRMSTFLRVSCIQLRAGLPGHLRTGENMGFKLILKHSLNFKNQITYSE